MWRPNRFRASSSGLALLAILACGGAGSGPDAVGMAVPRSIALAPQLTCLLGPVESCRGDERLDSNVSATFPTGSVQLIGGRFHACRRTRRGGVECWGSDRDGQLGVAPAEVAAACSGRRCRRGPAAVPGLDSVTVGLAAGSLHTCALDATGVVRCWGDNRLGQLGRAARGPQVGEIEALDQPVAAIAAGELHSCAALISGSVVCWGDGSEGQVGPAAVQGPNFAAVAVSGVSAATAIALGAEHSCALLADGSVQCWGSNRFGQLGDATITGRSEPGAVGGLPGSVEQIVAGDYFTCARLTSGEALCWGSHQLGQLGGELQVGSERGGLTCSAGPVRVHLDEGVSSLAAAGDHACALTSDGVVWCWGSNELGQLADGSREDRHAPVRWAGAAPPPLASAPTSPPADPVHGLDVSYHSGEIDWPAARTAGHRFGFTLATAGEDFRDPLLPAHWARLREAGLHRGAYHFFVPADDPAGQAQWFLSQVELEPGDLPPVVDIESLGANPPSDLAARLRVFVELLEAATGVPPIIYTGPKFWDRYVGPGFGEYPLWVAHYDVPEPLLPAGWTSWTLWQWRGDAEIEGVGAPIDLDQLVSAARLEALRLPVAVEQPRRRP